jgi:predicted PurR-regulated permease PerM
MLSLINILIIFFIILVGYQLILATRVTEGLKNSNEFRPYDLNDPNNALILGQQNAGNINFLKNRIDSVQGLNQQVQDLSGNVSALQDQVNGLITAQKDYSSQMLGDTPPDITGAVSDKPVDSSQFVL